MNQQNVHAFAGDMGLTSTLQPVDDCTPTQVDCLAAPNGDGTGGEKEVSDNILRLVTFYTRNLGVPERRDVGAPRYWPARTCSSRPAAKAVIPAVHHRPRHPRTRTGQPGDPAVQRPAAARPGARSGRQPQRIQSLRAGLAYPPLWGIGLTETVSGHTQFLHDGRARICWRPCSGTAAKPKRRATMY